MRLAHGVSCALILTCALVPAAVAQQQSSGGDSATASTAAKKPAAKKPATKSASATHRPLTHSSATHPSATTNSTAKSRTAATSSRSSSKASSRKKTVRARGQQKIDSGRAEQIQTALIREHYLTGEPTGTWNSDSEEAMRRYQGDHGWQTKEVPDARALIKLGLGPSNDHLLNPESAMTTSADTPRAASLPTTSHSAPTAADPVSPSSSVSSTSSTATPAATPASTGTTPPAPTANNPQP
jgi:hypothetical protein